MEIIVLPSRDEVANLVADSVTRILEIKKKPVLGLATGSSPMGVYQDLVKRNQSGDLSFVHTKAFLLDEYIGLPIGHSELSRETIARNFTNMIDIDPKNIFVPNVYDYNVSNACKEYEMQIRDAGGIDLQILGIGSEGHIAFNEQGSSLVSRTRLKTLTERTRQDNARFFNSITDVPKHVITQGLGTIMDAERIILVAFGANKAKAIQKTVEGPLSASCPASILQMHERTVVVIDEAAASCLERVDYYKHTFAAKPSWQHAI